MARDTTEGIAEEGELFRTHIGGSALTEGVMMRGKLSWAVAVRMPTGGIYLEEHELKVSEQRSAWKRWPIVRGCVAFVESMVLSVKSLNIAADHAYDAEGNSFASLVKEGVLSWDERAHEASAGPAFVATAQEVIAGEPAGGDVLAAEVPAANETGASEALVANSSAEDASAAVTNAEEPPAASSPDAEGDEGLPPALMFGSMVLGLVLGIALFVALPVAVANLLVGDYAPENAIVWNLVEAALRIAIFIGYIWGVGRMPEMARVFGYHGAEHLSIHCFEHGMPLTPANAARFSRLHVRCGTAFLIMTMIVAILVNTLVPVAAWAESLGIAGFARGAFVFASRLVLIPVVAGLSYEVTVKWAGSHPENPIVRIVMWPGLQMQRLTTRVPDEGMLECAIAALECVRRREQAVGIAAGEACCK